MSAKIVEVNLFGTCVVRGNGFEITGIKQKALFALLVTAPFGRRTRTFLQDALWGTACYDTGRQSLRRALADIKIIMGQDYDSLFIITNGEIGLDLGRVSYLGRPGGGEFLEGIDIREERFNEWLQSIRLSPSQLYSLFSLPVQNPPKPVLPVIAILPFQTLGLNSNEAVLGDWVAEELSRTLSRSRLLAVISHLSSRRAGGASIDLNVVSGQLGADFCVCGTIRPSQGKLLLDADFIDVHSGRILWTRRFIGHSNDIYHAQSEPLAQIVSAIGRAIASESLLQSRATPLLQLEDRYLLIAGVTLLHELRISDFARSRQMLEEIVRRAPLTAEAHAWLAEWHVMSIFNGWSTNKAKDTKTAQDYAARALDIEPDNSFCMTIDGVVHNNLLMQLDTAEVRFKSALDLNPNESMAWLLSGVLHGYRDEGAVAVEHVERSLLLSPMDPFDHFYQSLAASAHISNGNFPRALELATSSFEKNDRHLSTLRAQICALVNLGRLNEAKSAAHTLMARVPGCNIHDYLKGHPAAKFRFGHIHAEALAKAGIPMEPS